MASKDEIKKALLQAAGNPESGMIYEAIDDMVKAVDKLYNPEVKNSVEPTFDKVNRETQIITPSEKR
jgi:hypothetical protein